MGRPMIALRGRATSGRLAGRLERRVWLLVDRHVPQVSRGAQAQLIESSDARTPGFDLYVQKSNVLDTAAGLDCIDLPPRLDHLTPGDIISISDDGARLSVLWRNGSQQNSVLLTERCDHYCLMCSQPPKT